MDADVVVVGAGPAGSAAAARAAAAGASVVLLDRAAFPRSKPCGDILSAAALDESGRMGVDVTRLDAFRALHSMVVRLADRSCWQVSYDLPIAGTVPRREFDAELLAAARAAGASVSLEERVTGVRLASDEVSVETSRRTVRAPYVLAADGARSQVAKIVGRRGVERRDETMAARLYHPEDGDGSTLLIDFNPAVEPGYIWSSPTACGSNLGLGSETPRPIAERRFRTVLEEAAGPTGATRVDAWPIRAWAHPLAHPRVLAVGHPLGAADPLSGEGISQALWSGRRSAAIVVDSARAADVATRYATDVVAPIAHAQRQARLLLRLTAAKRVAAADGGQAASFVAARFMEGALGTAAGPSQPTGRRIAAPAWFARLDELVRSN